MTYEMYRLIFVITGIAGGVLLFISVILFFGLNIPKVIGDLTGRNARRAINDIREKNKISVRAVNNNRKKHSLKESVNSSENGTTITQKLAKSPIIEGINMESVSIIGSEETVLLDKAIIKAISIVEDITYIHTNEVID